MISTRTLMRSEVVSKREIRRVGREGYEDLVDHLIVEEPLEIRIRYHTAHGVFRSMSLAVTMRTPGRDEDLVRGFLLTEGIINDSSEIDQIRSIETNIVQVQFQESVIFDTERHRRNFYVTSSCGVCGKAAIEHIESISTHLPWRSSFTIRHADLVKLPDLLRADQASFAQTGGVHACALVDSTGQIRSLCEDVGRHNAMDKLIGCNSNLPLRSSMVLLSGRASFELIQKAVKAGIGMVAAIGAPSSLAVDLASGHGMTLVGFLKASSYNIYCGSERVLTEADG